MTFKLLLAKAVHYVCYAAVWGVAIFLLGIILISELAIWRHLLMIGGCVLGGAAFLFVWAWAADVIDRSKPAIRFRIGGDE